MYNKQWLLLPIVLILFTSYTPTPGYTINGNIQGITSGTVYLEYEYNYTNHTDSAVIRDGQFMLKGQVPEPLICTLRISGNNQVRIFFVQNTTMQVKGQASKLFDLTVTGSAENEVWNEYKHLHYDVIGNKIMEVRQRIKEAQAHDSVGANAPHTMPVAYVAEIDRFKDSVLTIFVRTHSNAVATAFAIYQTYISYSAYTRAEALFNQLQKPVQYSYYGRRIKDNFDSGAKTAIGKIAPPFSLPDTTGKMISLQQLATGMYLSTSGPAGADPVAKKIPTWCRPITVFITKALIYSVYLSIKAARHG